MAEQCLLAGPATFTVQRCHMFERLFVRGVLRANSGSCQNEMVSSEAGEVYRCNFSVRLSRKNIRDWNLK